MDMRYQAFKENAGFIETAIIASSHVSEKVIAVAAAVPLSDNTTELKDKKLRYEDAINSTKAAIEMGITPGGGATLINLIKLIDDLKTEFLKYV
jgi:chaperonin GroEL (HSP60 family)